MLRSRIPLIVASVTVAILAPAAGAAPAADESTAFQVTPGHTGFSSGVARAAAAAHALE